MKKGISQEALKLLACMTMLIDHIGYEILYPLYYSRSGPKALYQAAYLCRIVGRLSFPLFAFLLVEGIQHSRNRKKYALRLAIGALLAEIPYNLMAGGSLFCPKQSVMLTLLLGFCGVLAMERCSSLSWKPVVMLPFAIAAEILQTDYGWGGIAVIGIFALSRELYRKNMVRFGGLAVLSHYMSNAAIWIGNVSIPMQAVSALSVVFIANYDGRKLTRSKALQWAFYLFYPVHMLILWYLGTFISGGVSI